MDHFADARARHARRRLGAAALLSLLGAAALTIVVVLHVGPAVWDPAVARAAVSVRSPVVTSVLRAVTFAGSARVLVPVSVVLVVVLALRRQPRRAAVVAVGMLGAEIVAEVAKVLVARPRPPGADRIGPAAATYSFPSGHTLSSAVLLGLVVWLVWPVGTRAARASAVAAAVVLTVAVATSRVYLGYHWLTDVVASVLLATAWVSALAAASTPRTDESGC